MPDDPKRKRLYLSLDAYAFKDDPNLRAWFNQVLGYTYTDEMMRADYLEMLLGLALKSFNGQQQKRIDGKKSAIKKADLNDLTRRNKKIAARYNELLKAHAKHEITGILAREFDLSKSQIYRIPKPHK